MTVSAALLSASNGPFVFFAVLTNRNDDLTLSNIFIPASFYAILYHFHDPPSLLLLIL
jgi:hypothetical protein